DDVITIPGGQTYHARQFVVEPDVSAAGNFAAAAALCGGEVKIQGLHRDSVQGDLGFFGLLERMGAHVEWAGDGVVISGTGRLDGLDVAMNSMPDMVPTLAAIAPFASSETRIREVGFIRYHESDRLRALATELRRLGATVADYDDGIGIEPSRLVPATIETYDDHRIAMSFVIAALRLAGLQENKPDHVSCTYDA